jgi:uncharacterized protein YciI
MENSGTPPVIRFVAAHTPGPLWNAALGLAGQTGLPEHAAYYAGALAAGHLERGGPFVDGSGGMMVFKPEVTKSQAEEIANADPTVRSGLLLVEIKPWLSAFWP